MKSIVIAVFVMALLSACGSTAPIASREGFAGLYSVPGGELRLEARVYHGAPDQSVIHFKLYTDDLLYKSDGGGPPYHARVRITYEAFPGWESRQLIDSASTLVNDQSDLPDEQKELVGTLDMRRNEHISFVLKVTAHDLNRDAKTVVTIPVQRDGIGTRQYFLPLSTTTGLPLFDDHVAPGTHVIIRSERYAGSTLFAAHFPQRSGLPAPVFSTGSPPAADGKPDSLFTVTVSADGDFGFVAGANGFFHFRPDSASAEGYTLFSLGDSYPDVRSARAMIAPLRYITSMQEYDAMNNASNGRKAVERFWVDAAGDRERARDAIRAYYRRVETANRHFTSHLEGWKTDRGLTLIIFGMPNTVHKSATSETWIYGEETNLMSMSFTFTQRSAPFTDNDLVLERDPVYKAAWYRNVESWRNGRVYQN